MDFRASSLFERFGEGTFGSAGVVRFGDPTLKAEPSISADGGFDQRLANHRVLLFGATYFYTRLQRISRESSKRDNTFETYYENGFLAPRAVGRGGGRVKFSHRLHRYLLD